VEQEARRCAGGCLSQQMYAILDQHCLAAQGEEATQAAAAACAPLSYPSSRARTSSQPSTSAGLVPAVSNAQVSCRPSQRIQGKVTPRACKKGAERPCSRERGHSQLALTPHSIPSSRACCADARRWASRPASTQRTLNTDTHTLSLSSRSRSALSAGGWPLAQQAPSARSTQTPTLSLSPHALALLSPQAVGLSPSKHPAHAQHRHPHSLSLLTLLLCSLRRRWASRPASTRASDAPPSGARPGNRRRATHWTRRCSCRWRSCSTSRASRGVRVGRP
jgi:hypothetical protein